MSPVSPVYGVSGLFLLTSEVWKQWCITQINRNVYIWWYLPFQLCSIPMYVCLAIGVLSSLAKYCPAVNVKQSENQITKLQSFLMTFGMLGGICAFFDTSGMRHGYLPLTIHSYTWHIALILLGIYSGLDPRTDHSRQGFMHSTVLYLICCGIASLLNHILDPLGVINLFYINPHYRMQQKVFRDIANILGNSWGIFLYIAGTITGAWLLHRLWNRINYFRFGKLS